jgi:hypothetical protein
MKILLMVFFSLFLYASESHFIKSDNVVIDTKKNLMWQDNEDVTVYKTSWGLAKDYCETLTLSGYTDWRLPTVKDLQGIVDIKKAKPAIYEEFKFCESTSYWTRSLDMSNKNHAWYVGFKTGATYKDSKDYDCYVRCVRTRFKQR